MGLLEILWLIAFPLGVLTAVVTVITLLMRPSRDLAREWQEAADQLGMERVQLIPDIESVLEGKVGRFHVRAAEGSSQGAGSSFKATELTIRGGLPAAVNLIPERFILGRIRASTIRGAEDLEIGDPDFDRRVVVQGDLAVALALLDHEARAEVSRWLGNGARLHEGRLFRAVRGRLHKADQLLSALRQMLDLAELLAEPDDLVPRLARVALHDPMPAVRANAVAALGQRFGDRDEARKALATALEDRNDEVRLRAAVALGSEASHVLREFLVADSSTMDQVAQAATALGTELSEGDAMGLLDRGLVHDQPAIVGAAMMVLAHIASPAALQRLGALVSDAVTDIAVAAAQALGQSETPEAESPLLAGLECDQSEVRRAAAHALRRVGTVASVQPLHRAVEQHSWDRELRHTAAAAVRKIQERATGAAPGQLTLTGGDTGDLALADHDHGELTILDEDDTVLE